MSLQVRNAVSRHMIDYGVTLNHESVSEFSREWELRDSAGFSLPGNSAGDLLMLYNMSSDNSLSSNRVMAFLQDTYRIDNGRGFFSLNGVSVLQPADLSAATFPASIFLLSVFMQSPS